MPQAPLVVFFFSSLALAEFMSSFYTLKMNFLGLFTDSSHVTLSLIIRKLEKRRKLLIILPLKHTSYYYFWANTLGHFEMSGFDMILRIMYKQLCVLFLLWMYVKAFHLLLWAPVTIFLIAAWAAGAFEPFTLIFRVSWGSQDSIFI